MRGRFRRFFRRWTTPAAFVESRREHVASYPPMPPPPPPEPDPIHGSTAARPPARALSARTGRQIKLILVDGSESALPEDPELAARADYFVKSMLPPRPPAPAPGAPSAPQARRV